MDYERLIIGQYEHWTLFLHSNQYYLGRAYAWSKRHVPMMRFTSLSGPEMKELTEKIGVLYEDALTALWQPTLFNWAWLGNEVATHEGHGHMHFIPRYKNSPTFAGISFRDDQWGKNYVPYPSLILPGEALLEIRDKLRNKLGYRGKS